jgi:hypothetical protein
MKFSHLGYELAIVAIICVLSIFLCPAAAGPYSAVHGPVSALQAIRNFMKLCCAMAMAAGFWHYRPMFSSSPHTRRNSSFLLPEFSLLSSILRC